MNQRDSTQRERESNNVITSKQSHRNDSFLFYEAKRNNIYNHKCLNGFQVILIISKHCYPLKPAHFNGVFGTISV